MSLPLPKDVTRTLSSKIENLVEYSYVPEDAQISETSTPLISPYNIFRRRRHSLRSITQLITSRRPPEKEYVQSSRLEQCTLVSTQQEQYVNLEIPPPLITHWQQSGYTHLHYGAVRLILTLHGRRGLPVAARVTLLDSSYIQYSNAVIGTVLTTLHAGSVVLTLFPNYNVSLRDPTLSHRLRVQVQLTGAEQVPEALSATLHHQMIYRLQNHAVNLALPTSNDGALFVIADQQEENPSIIHVPRNISRQELVQMIPVEWVTNYEKLHINKKPIQSTEATFRRSVDGRVVTVFKKLEDGPSSSSSIFQSMMIEPCTKEGKIPIWGSNPMEILSSLIGSTDTLSRMLTQKCASQTVTVRKTLRTPVIVMTNQNHLVLGKTFVVLLLLLKDQIRETAPGSDCINNKSQILSGNKKGVQRSYESMTILPSAQQSLA